MNKERMKKTVVTVLILASFLVGGSHAQHHGRSDAAEDVQNEWNLKIVSPYKHTHLNQVISTQDGYVAVGAKSELVNWTDYGRIIAVKFDGAGNILWNKTYGGVDSHGTAVVAGENGYLLVGYQGRGNNHIVTIKIDEDGREEWNKTYSVTGDDLAVDAVKAPDGYVIGGEPFSGPSQVFLLKIGEHGSIQWSTIYGGQRLEGLDGLLKTEDGYVFTGYTSSYGNGNWDAWLVKVDEQGSEMWNRTYGGSDTDEARCIAATDDGGFILAGATMSYGNGADDNFIIKTDADGIVEWTTVCGGISFDESEGIIATSDGYVIAGYTYSSGIGDFDALLLKIDNQGNVVWHKTFGTRDSDRFYGVIESDDGDGYIAVGATTISHETRKEAGWIVKSSDYSPPTLEIVRPKDHVYLFDREILPAGKTLVFGGITVKVEVDDPGRMIDTISFYLSSQDFYDVEPRKILHSPPYAWKWNSYAVALRAPWTVTVGAYYGQAGGVAADRETVYIINLGHSS